MTPPTLHELAGIFMLALATSMLISHPSAGSHPALTSAAEQPAFAYLEGFMVDGIPDAVSPAR